MLNGTAVATNRIPDEWVSIVGAQGPKVAYIMSRFPKITETFILYEMLALVRQGVQVEVYPLLREPAKVVHPEAIPFVKQAHFQPFLSWPILCAHAYFLRRKPRTYLGTLWTLLRANLGSVRFLSRALAIFPKTVYFARLMAVEGVTHVHAHFASHPTAAAFIIHRLVGIPYSFTAHGSDLHRDRHMLREKVAEAAFVVAISTYNRALIIKECCEQFCDKVVVIHCGVDTQVFQPRRNGADKPAADPFTILCIGTFHEVKGQTYLLAACRQLLEREINFACHFVGDGPDRPGLVEQADQTGLAGRVHFHGLLTRRQIVEMLQHADVVAVPSVPSKDGRREGIPVVLMEAMASGVPVVASRLSGIPELVEDEKSGLLLPPRDAQTLADALERIFRDPALGRRLGEEGRDKIVREFDLHANAAALAQRFSTGVAT